MPGPWSRTGTSAVAVGTPDATSIAAEPGRVLDRVGQQVEEDLLEPARSPGRHRAGPARIPIGGAFGSTGGHPPPIGTTAARSTTATRSLELAGLDPAHVEQPLDERRQSPRLATARAA